MAALSSTVKAVHGEMRFGRLRVWLKPRVSSTRPDSSATSV